MSNWRAERLSKLPPYLFVEIDRKKKEAIAAGRDVIDFGVGTRTGRRRRSSSRRWSRPSTIRPITATPWARGCRSFGRRSRTFSGGASASSLIQSPRSWPCSARRRASGIFPPAFLIPATRSSSPSRISGVCGRHGLRGGQMPHHAAPGEQRVAAGAGGYSPRGTAQRQVDVAELS